VEGTNSFEHWNRCWAWSSIFHFFLYPLLRAERVPVAIQVIGLIFRRAVFGVQHPANRSSNLTIGSLDNQSSWHLCGAITTAVVFGHYIAQA
jgi:hypothetical protein